MRDLEVAPNLRAGIGLVRPGPGTAIVGSPDTAVRTLGACRADRFAETVLPRLPVNRAAPSAKQFTWSNLFDRDLHAKAAGG